MPQPRNTCQHCGGIRCIGACQFNGKQPVAADASNNDQAAPQPELAPEVRDNALPAEATKPEAEGQADVCAAEQRVISGTVQKQK